MITTIIIIIFSIAWITLMALHQYNGELIINPIIGFMVGWLYDAEEFEDGTEHTIQILLGIISFTIIWATYE